MATRLYLRAALAAVSPTAGEKSTFYPQVGRLTNLNSGTGFEDLSLSTAKGAAQTSKVRATQADNTTAQECYIARFSSPALAAQTIAANTWSKGIAVQESNSNANQFMAAGVIYVWRPGTSSVVGAVYDASGTYGTEHTTSEDGEVLNISGSSVTTQDGDILVYEHWTTGTIQGHASSYNITVYFDGTTDVVEATTTDAASWLETPQNLVWYTPPSYQPRHAASDSALALV
jgi:hypothetical protein